MGTLNIKSQQSHPSVSSKISITPAIINLTPGTIIYDGTEKTQGVDDVIFRLTEGTDYILNGNTATNAGTYTITAVGTNSYKDATIVNWNIQKAASSITPSVSSLKIEDLEDTGTFIITTIGDGTVSVSSSNTAVATATLSGNTVTVSPVNEGTATIIITISESNNYNEASIGVSVSVDFTKVFGVVWNYGSAFPGLARLTPTTDPYEYVNTTILVDPVPAVGTDSGSSQFDNYMPWKGMEEYNVINNEVVYKKGDSNFSRANDTVVYIPEFYYKIIKNTAQYRHYFYISNRPFRDFEKHPGSGAYIGKYQLGSEYVCRTGTLPLVNITITTARTNITSKLGSKWSQWGLHHWNAIQLLYIIEFAHWNSQLKIGQGHVNSSQTIASGNTDIMTYHTGTVSDANGYGAVQYRGIENLWGNVHQIVDGINISSSSIYICTDPSKYNSGTSTNYTYAGSGATSNNSCITLLGYYGPATWMIFPTGTTSNTNNTYIPDSFSYNSSSWCTLFVGGYYGDQDAAGLFRCYYRYYGDTVEYGGSRPVFIP